MKPFKPRPGETEQQTGRRFEKYWAELFGVKPVKGSGNLWYAKLDVGTQGILFSCKWTSHDSFRISKDLFHEAWSAVYGQGGVGGNTIPALATNVNGETYVTMRAEDLLLMLQEETVSIPPSKDDLKRARSKVPEIFRED